MYPWLQRNGEFSALKLAVFILLFVPAMWLLYQFASGQIGARPLNELIRGTGRWGIRLLVISLAITPLRQVFNWAQLVLVRRMIGVAALVYLLTHFSLYIADQSFDLVKVGTEIVLRIYLLIGAVALLALIPLGITSTDAMIKRVGGKRWRQLHKLAYPIAVLALVHYFLQSKIDVSLPTMLAGFFIWLMGWRALAALPAAKQGVPVLWLLGLSVAACIVTMLGEAAYFGLFTGVKASRVLMADFSLPRGIENLRPMWWVLMAGLAVTVAAIARKRPATARRPMPARPTAQTTQTA